MSQGFVSDPRSVAKSGDVVRVKVLSVDIPRNRISLTMRLNDPAEGGAKAGGPARGSRPSSPRTDGAASQGTHPSPQRGADRTPGSRRPDGDRRGGGSGRGGAPAREGASGRGGDRRDGGSGHGGDRRPGSSPPASGAMAEALRKAGLLNDSGTPAKGKPAPGKGKPGSPTPRRDDRP
jgi:uncharacterized protein